MKKFLSVILTLCVAVALASVCFASVNEGKIYERNDEGRMEETSGDLIPGKTYYVYLVSDAAVKNGTEKPTRVSVDYECLSVETDKKFSLISSRLSVSKKKCDDDTYAYFAEMKLKEIPTASYSYDGYTLEIKGFDVTPEGIDVGEIIGTRDVEYPQGSEINDDLQFFELDDTTDTYSVGNTDAEVLIDSTGVKTKAIISCDNSYDSSFGNKYSTANLDFYYFNNAKLRRQATVTIPMGSSKYLYESTSNGLKEITKSKDNKFVFKTATLGKYILSDKRLASTVEEPVVTPSTPTTTTPSTSTTAPSTPAETLPNLPGAPTGGYIPYNPGTGACL